MIRKRFQGLNIVTIIDSGDGSNKSNTRLPPWDVGRRSLNKSAQRKAKLPDEQTSAKTRKNTHKRGPRGLRWSKMSVPTTLRGWLSPNRRISRREADLPCDQLGPKCSSVPLPPPQGKLAPGHDCLWWQGANFEGRWGLGSPSKA